MAANPYNGEVELKLGERNVILRFTWRTRAILQAAFEGNYERRIAQALTNRHIADLAIVLSACSGGVLEIDEIMENDFPIHEVCEAILQSFKFSHHGLIEPKLEGEQRPHPTSPQQTKLLGRIKQLLRLA